MSKDQDHLSNEPRPPSEEYAAKPGAEITFPLRSDDRRRVPQAVPASALERCPQGVVPGRTAARRIGRWLAENEAEADAHADAKGRDAFDFDPIDSPYLELGKAAFRIHTPYSKAVVDEFQEVPYARWDGDLRIWHVSYRSYEDIEAAARRNEPEERRRRAEERNGTEEERRSKLRSAEGSAAAIRLHTMTCRRWGAGSVPPMGLSSSRKQLANSSIEKPWRNWFAPGR